MNIQVFQRSLTRRLLAWNVINLMTGLWLSRRGEFWRGFGSQNIGWSLVNLAIAGFGARSSARVAREAVTIEGAAREGRQLRRLLWINTGLDVLYMLGGWRMAQRNTAEPLLRGMGWGIVVQGALLFVFDLIHAPGVPIARNGDATTDDSTLKTVQGQRVLPQ